VHADDWVPPTIDADRPSPARVYDYLLGGGHNFAADRRVVERLLVVFPEAPLVAQANRAFLRRAVKFLVDRGIRQFLDIGSGIPTLGHVHEIAQGLAPDSRIVYVDIDPVAVAHSREVVAGNDRAAAIQEDFRRPEQILDDPDVRRLFDFGEPVAVLMVALFHHLSDADDPVGLMARLTEPLVAGSYIVASHITGDGGTHVAKALEIYRGSGMDVTSRSRTQIEALFAGWDLVAPGVVWAPQWRPEWPPSPDDWPERSAAYVGIARKRREEGMR
jgi:SAM-dependent methyltransferase